jgi:multicomponent Na+:H+ antiporter subunit A
VLVPLGERDRLANPATARSSSPRTSRFALLGLVPAVLFVATFSAFVSGSGPIEVSLPWVPSLGVDARFVVDAFSLFFIMLITGVGTCVFVYAASYLGDEPRRHRLFAWLMVFMIAMIGTVAADDLIVVYTFWELTSLSSFMLVSFYHESELARRSARQAMMVTFGGGFVLLLGIVVLGQLAGTTSIRGIIEAREILRDDPRATFAMFCVFTGAFTKSAQVPFHFWLPNAMAAPTPVSAYLHSATMVKLGVYLLARLDLVFAEEWLWPTSLIAVGGVTSAWGMFQTIHERDLKRILAWSTVSALGTMVMLIGLPGPESATALVAFVLAHALYKAPLFFVAGNVDHATGTRDIGHLASLAGSMPWTATVALAAAISMGGLPLSFGYFAKELIYIAKSEGDLYLIIGYGSVPISAITLAVAAIAAARIFWHRGGMAIPSHVHDVPAAMRLPPLVLALGGVFLGLFPEVADPLITSAAAAIDPATVLGPAMDGNASRDAWGLLPVYALGALIFVFWDHLHKLVERVRLPPLLHAAEHLERSQRSAVEAAARVTRALQHGRLSGYTRILFTALLASLVMALALVADVRGVDDVFAAAAFSRIDGAALAILGASSLLVVASLLLPFIRDTFLLLLVSGMMGIGLSLVFLFSGAPDLAFTQFLVEVALVVVIASVLLRVRILGLAHPPRRAGALRVGVSALIGAGVAAVMLLAHDAGTASTALADYFGENALNEAHGRNVVNVILVDFRAIDTLGEIVVLLLALLAAVPIFAVFGTRGEGRS